MHKQLMKGNEAIVKSAILAGCRAFYGYPITPASEIAEAAALHASSRRRLPAGRERSRLHQHALRRGRPPVCAP
jgi:pyruvate/2-oxoacid:ferredoxin oxidoreductase alpha subunit